MENTSTVVYISATKSSKELILVSNDCFDNSITTVIRYINKLAILMLKYLKELQILEKNDR